MPTSIRPSCHRGCIASRLRSHRSEALCAWILVIVGCAASPQGPDVRQRLLADMDRAQTVTARQAVLERLETLPPEVRDDPAVLAGAADLRRALGDWAGAAELFGRLAEVQSDSDARRAARQGALSCLLNDGRWDRARPIIERLGALRDDADNRLRGLHALTANDGDQAHRALERMNDALVHQPGDRWLLTAAAVLSWRIGESGQAYLLAAQALADGSQSLPLLPAIRASALAEFEPREAAVLFEALPVDSPLSARLTAGFLAEHGRLRLAGDVLDNWLERHPLDARTAEIAGRLKDLIQHLPPDSDIALEHDDG